MRTNQNVVKAMRIVMATTLGMHLPLSANEARGIVMLVSDGTAYETSLGSVSGGLELSRTGPEVLEMWYGYESGIRLLTMSPGAPVFTGRENPGRLEGREPSDTTDLFGDIGMTAEGVGMAKARKVRVASPVDPVPEPASLVLLGAGILALAAGRMRRKRKA